MPAQADDAPGAAGSPERRDSADFSPAAGQAQRAAGGFEAETPSEQWGPGATEPAVAGSGASPEDDGSYTELVPPRGGGTTLALLVLMAVAWVFELLSPLTIEMFSLVPALSGAQPWRFITAAFLHSYPLPLHLICNGYALWIVGRALEPLIGHLRLLAAFALCAIAGMLAQCLLVLVNPLAWVTPTVGASGAVFGFFGMVLAIRKTLRLPGGQIFALLAVNLLIGFALPSIAWMAHIGGLLMGLVIGCYAGHILKHSEYKTMPGEDKSPSYLLIIVSRTTRAKLRDFCFYFGLLLALCAGIWLFYHFSFPLFLDWLN